MQSLETLDEFSSLTDLELCMHIREHEQWDPRPIAITVKYLKARGVRVRVPLVSWGYMSDGDRETARRDVSAYFDPPTEAEIKLLDCSIRCSPDADPRTTTNSSGTANSAPMSKITLPCLSRRREWESEGNKGCEKVAGKLCPSSGSLWHASWYRAFIRDYQDKYSQLDHECLTCTEAYKRIGKYQTHDHRIIKVSIEKQEGKKEYDESGKVIHAMHCTCVDQCRFPEGIPEDFEYMGNPSEWPIYA